MTVNVKLFAIVRDRAGVSATTLVLPDTATVATALTDLAVRYPAAAGFLPRVACAVNREYVSPSAQLHDGDELAIIPPVSGG